MYTTVHAENPHKNCTMIIHGGALRNPLVLMLSEVSRRLSGPDSNLGLVHLAPGQAGSQLSYVI
jgi:hypothetical protein